MNFGDLKGPLDYIISLLKKIDRNTDCIACNGGGGGGGNVVVTNDTDNPVPVTLVDAVDPVTQSTAAGTGNIPAGFKSIAIVKTNGTGTVNVTLSNASIYPLTLTGEGISDAATGNNNLPAYTIASADGGTWKWHGIN